MPQKSKHNTERINWLKSRLSWRVILCVFVTLMFVQGMILFFTVQSYEQERLNELSETGRSAVLLSLQQSRNSGNKQDLLWSMLQKTNVRGVALFDNGRTIAHDVYGEPPVLSPHRLDANQQSSWLSKDKSRYEVSFGQESLIPGVVAVIRMDADSVKNDMRRYITQTAMISLLLAAFITTVLILVLGMWMLEPILLLRNNLLGAAKDPTTAIKYLTPYKRRDELGSVISSANKLIRQNAENLTRLSQQVQDRIYRLAFFDALTELPNRAHFLNKLDEIIQAENMTHPRIGVLVVDIDHFGDVNDTLGFESGDLLLKIVSKHLSEALPDALLVARLGEDEFAAILQLPADPHDEINRATTAVMNVFSQSFDIQGNDLVLEASAGMAMWPNDADRAIDLMKKAESALDQAKLEDKGRFRLYSSSFEQAVQTRIQMVRDLRVAIEENQFSLVYQPQFDARTRKIIGAEALLRWEKPDPETKRKAFVRPDHFIPVAEQSGLIVPIGRWVLEEACRFTKECIDQGIQPFRMAVNLSGVQFARDDVVYLVREVLRKTGLSANLLELEVTESAVMKDINQTIALLKQLCDLGVELAIDDFGTGYSSLSYLKRFPVQRLKVDRSFVMNVTESKDDASITKTIIQLGHSMGLKVIAEGVETENQVRFLNDHQCDEFQGYFFSKPLPPAEFRGFVRGYVLPKEEKIAI